MLRVTGADVVHVGDLFHGRGGHSVSDRDNAGGDVEGLTRSLGKLVSRLDSGVRILCGHGGVGQVAELRDLEAYQEMLVEVLGQVRERAASGASVEEVVAEGVPPCWRSWFASARGDSVMHGGADGWLANLIQSSDDDVAAVLEDLSHRRRSCSVRRR